jgi:hypothetical protein
MRHRLHSLCPYFAMFPETFVEKWVSELTQRQDIVLDPFSGRGTTAFQGLLMERRTIACDVNPVAYCITRAKTNAPTVAALRRRWTMLERAYSADEWNAKCDELPEFFSHAYHQSTLAQLLYLRDRLRWAQLDTDCMLAALVLGSLHGETNKSKYYLSNQMPRTISTKPRYSVNFWRERNLVAPLRDVFDVIRSRIAYRYASAPPAGRATVFNADMRTLPDLMEPAGDPIRCVITSPPYLDITNYEEDQWLRLWFLGGEPWPTYRQISRDDRHANPERYWTLLSDMWGVLGRVLAPDANVVVRLGGKGLTPDELADGLLRTSAATGRQVRLAGEYEVSNIKGRQTDSFRPGTKGCVVEVDCHFVVA